MRLNLRTHQVILLSLAIISGRISEATASMPQNFSAELSRAISFYNANEFQESVILLTELDKRVGTEPQTKTELLIVKVYLALALVGLKQNDQAKARFVELCKLDNTYVPNLKDSPPDAIVLYNQAKASCEANSSSTTSSRNNSIAQAIFLQGKELYESGKFRDALKYFNVVLAMDSTHELAREYSELTRQRLKVLTERLYVEWRTNFGARQFEKAAAVYRRIRADQELDSGELPARIASEYEKALLVPVNSWKEACASRDGRTLDSLRDEVLTIAPGLPFALDALGHMPPCPGGANVPDSSKQVEYPSDLSTARTDAEGPAAEPDPPRTPPSQSVSSCMHGDPLLAMARIKTRINPQIEPSLQRYIGRGIVVSIHIDEQGNVAVKEVAKASPRIAEAIKSAVEQWKFKPAVIDNQARCVETDIPIALIQP
jgi:tetratricopeptide (TPR) repeat protein